RGAAPGVPRRARRLARGASRGRLRGLRGRVRLPPGPHDVGAPGPALRAARTGLPPRRVRLAPRRAHGDAGLVPRPPAEGRGTPAGAPPPRAGPGGLPPAPPRP